MEEWFANKIPRLALFYNLIICSRDYPVARIVGLLEGKMAEDFREKMMGYKGCRDEDFSDFNNPPYWGMEDANRFIRFYEEAS